jgi:hypothetical protein
MELQEIQRETAHQAIEEITTKGLAEDTGSHIEQQGSEAGHVDSPAQSGYRRVERISPGNGIRESLSTDRPSHVSETMAMGAQATSG